MKVNPNSLANLEKGRKGSKPRYGKEKKRRHISVTDESWEVVKPLIKKELGLSISEMVEQIGRGKFKVVKVEAE